MKWPPQEKHASINNGCQNNEKLLSDVSHTNTHGRYLLGALGGLGLRFLVHVQPLLELGLAKQTSCQIRK